MLCVATTGIASTHYLGGSTAHALFRIKICNLPTDTPRIDMKFKTTRGSLIKSADAIVWDELANANRADVEVVDQWLRKLMNVNIVFGGKMLIGAGDFRQIPPVVRYGDRADIFNACIKSSPTWAHFQEVRLRKSMRSAGDLQYVKFCTRIGNGKLTPKYISNNGFELVSLDGIAVTNSLDEFIAFVFPSLSDADTENAAILTTLNVNVKEFNSIILNRMKGTLYTMHSSDRIEFETSGQDNHSSFSDTMSEEFLHSLNQSGVPPHALELKIGARAILLRNYSRRDNLMNNAPVTIVSISRRLVVVKNIDNKQFCIPRLSFKFTLPSMNFSVIRVQFPLALAYATSFNKSQSLTFRRIGLDLRGEVFCHGHLYTALSRIPRRTDVVSLTTAEKIINNTCITRNVFWSEFVCGDVAVQPTRDTPLIRLNFDVSSQSSTNRPKTLNPSDVPSPLLPREKHFMDFATPYREIAQYFYSKFQESAIIPSESVIEIILDLEIVLKHRYSLMYENSVLLSISREVWQNMSYLHNHMWSLHPSYKHGCPNFCKCRRETGLSPDPFYEPFQLTNCTSSDDFSKDGTSLRLCIYNSTNVLLHFYLLPMPKDNHCLFHCITSVCKSKSVLTIRADLATLYVQYADTYFPVLQQILRDAIWAETGQTVQEYSAAMQGDHWGGLIDIAVLSSIYGFGCTIYTKANTRTSLTSNRRSSNR